MRDENGLISIQTAFHSFDETLLKESEEKELKREEKNEKEKEDTSRFPDYITSAVSSMWQDANKDQAAVILNASHTITSRRRVYEPFYASISQEQVNVYENWMAPMTSFQYFQTLHPSDDTFFSSHISLFDQKTYPLTSFF